MPPNYTWADLEPGVNGINRANYRDIYWSIPLSFALLLLKNLFER